MSENRRDFLKKAGLLAGGMTLLRPSLTRALAIDPAEGSTFLDAEHVVFLMQENRSFDHTYGMLRGVRGFNDPRAITLASGNPVWMQTSGDGQTFGPFHLDIKGTKATWMESLPHSWSNQTDARNDGRFDRWIDVKKGAFPKVPMTMGYYDRSDIPFYYELADAFTVCDQNFCSSQTGTTPNRLHFWTGAVRGSLVEAARVRNEMTDYDKEASWTTYPERLEAAGVSWKVYQNEISLPSGLEGEHDDWLTNFGDNPLEWFRQYRVRFSPTHLEYLRTHQPDSEEAQHTLPLYDPAAFAALSEHERNLFLKAFATNSAFDGYRSLEELSYDDAGVARKVLVPKGDVLHQFRADVASGALPTVSWLVPPEHYSDHPSSAWYGTWYVSEVLDILTRNPEVWKKTIFILTYDENDGYFDHVPPFVVPSPFRDDSGKVSFGIDVRPEYITLEEDRLQTSSVEAREGSIGLGFRVPLVVASPWTRGGWVNSEVFDHTSSLQFLETFLSRKMGLRVVESNISSWRRAVCGDLTSVFRPYNGEVIAQPAFQDKDQVIEDIHKAQFKPLPSGFAGAPMPRQEVGVKPSNGLAYELYASGGLSGDASGGHSGGDFVLTLEASRALFGARALGAPFNVYAPGSYLQVPRSLGKAVGDPVLRPLKFWSYAVLPGDKISDRFPLSHFEGGRYFLRVYGPNGFFREFKGDASDPLAPFSLAYRRDGGLSLVFPSVPTPAEIVLTDHGFKKNDRTFRLTDAPVSLDLDTVQGWYDFSLSVKGFPEYSRRFAGRVETGADSITDPVMGGVA